MTRSPLFLAALASSAVPGLDPASVRAVPTRQGDPFEEAHVKDSQDRLWAIKAPRTPASGAALEDVTTLSQLLGRRLDFAIPIVRGQVTVPEGRAVVYLRVPGQPLDFSALPPGRLAGEVGRTLAHIHNVEHLLFEEAGLASYDAESHRRRQLSELDRAAATGHVPTHLLTRWEAMLEDVSLWRFASCPVHGTFSGENVLASFDDEQDAGTGRVRGVLAWEAARIGDPADDFAELITLASPDAVDSVLEAYAQSRVERPDAGLLRRARLAGEMLPVRTLLRALSAGDLPVVEEAAESLRALDEQTEADDRQHAEEDAARAERQRQERAAAFAAADAAAGRARPQNLPDEAEWVNTEPHVPFVRSGASDESGQVTDLAGDPAAPGDLSAGDDGPGGEGGGAGEPDPGLEDPTRASDSGEVPLTALDDETSFEIEQAEPLPEGSDAKAQAVVDEHEGASEFVPVKRPEEPSPRGGSGQQGPGDDRPDEAPAQAQRQAERRGHDGTA